MSYILEAIKKADRKRKLGEVPNVHTDHDGLDPEGSGKRPYWPYLLAMILFFNAGVLVWWLHPWQGNSKPKAIAVEDLKPAEEVIDAKSDVDTLNKKEPSEKATVPAGGLVNIEEQDGGPAEMPGEPGESGESAEQIKAQADLPENQVEGDSQALADKPSLPLPLPLPTGPLEVAKSGPVSLVGEGEKQATSKEALPVSGEVEKLIGEGKSKAAEKQFVPTGEITKKADETPDGESGTIDTIDDDQLSDASEMDDFGETDESDNGTAEQVIEVEIFDITKVPFVYQLPTSTQQKVPEIKISFHSYTFRPVTRMIRVNGLIMREGQSLTKEIKLEKIVPTGAVFVIEKSRFRVDV